ncbi:MAG: lipid-A-disaccharide synthase [Gemmataceae bacterium]
MHLFISAGEPSGDLHGANLIHALKARHPHAKIVGFGGDKMTAAGAELLYPLTQLAVMWVGRVLMNIRTFFRLADQAEDYFRTQKPDAVILIDYPGFHWHIAKRAKAAGIPVYYFVPPQLWAWAGWRVKKMRATVNTVLTALPFEEDWYSARNVNTHYVGHPYYDEIVDQRLDAAFQAELKGRGEPIIALLPGSRTQEVTSNFPLMLRTVAVLHQSHPQCRFVIAAYNAKQAALMETMLAKVAPLPIELHIKKTAEIISVAHASIAVSGSVGLELLAGQVPSVIVYKLSRFALPIARFFMKCRFISLVNLLAQRELFPEFLTARDDSVLIAAHIQRWLDDPQARAERVRELETLRASVMRPGACERAAEYLMKALAPQRQAA